MPCSTAARMTALSSRRILPSPLQITTPQARQYAAKQGYAIPYQSLNSACERGNIPGAIKEHGATHSRWRIPRQQFLIWFERWKAAKATSQKRGTRPEGADADIGPRPNTTPS